MMGFLPGHDRAPDSGPVWRQCLWLGLLLFYGLSFLIILWEAW